MAKEHRYFLEILVRCFHGEVRQTCFIALNSTDSRATAPRLGGLRLGRSERTTVVHEPGRKATGRKRLIKPDLVALVVPTVHRCLFGTVGPYCHIAPRNSRMISELAMSMKNAPTSGTIRKAPWDGP